VTYGSAHAEASDPKPAATRGSSDLIVEDHQEATIQDQTTGIRPLKPAIIQHELAA
jgi:hypothetical protein